MAEKFAEKNCLKCSITFQPTGACQKFCSESCRISFHPKRVYDKEKHHAMYLRRRERQRQEGLLPDPVCQECGLVFRRTSNFRNQKFCSRLCSSVYGRRRRVERKNDPEHKRKSFYRSIEWKYNLSREKYDRMLHEQKGLCFICLREVLLVVDHDHSTGIVRGLLCRTCNRVIGMLMDDPDRCMRAASYLRKDR